MNPFQRKFDGVFQRVDFPRAVVQKIQRGIKRGRFAHSGGACYKNQAARSVDDRHESIEIGRMKSDVLHAQEHSVTIQKPDGQIFAVQRGQCRQTEINAAAVAERHMRPTILRMRRAGDIHVGDGFDVRDESNAIFPRQGSPRADRAHLSDGQVHFFLTRCQEQIAGGVGFGQGYALTEEFETGATESLTDYHIATVMDMPEIVPIIVENVEPSGPFGAKGIGEPALIPTAPAILNAIEMALGVRIYELPANLERVLDASRAAGWFDKLAF